MVCLHIHALFLSLLWSGVVSQTAFITSHPLKDPDILLSSNAIFKLGFFSPANSTNRYLGIWYNVPDSDVELEVVWVANPDNPLNDSSGVLQISDDGNLQVVDGHNKRIWSSNVSSYKANYSVALLQDNGCLALLANDSGSVIWQSFQHPTNTILPGMTFTIDGKLTEKQVLFWSWKSPSNPSPGNFTIGIRTRTPPEAFIWDGNRPHWRNGPWTGNIFVGLDSVVLSIVTDGAGKIYYELSPTNQPSFIHFVLTVDGIALGKNFDSVHRKWEIGWNTRQSRCDLYGNCGPYGSCKGTNSPICSCLRGFVPKNNTEWSKGNWKNGCVRRTSLLCGTAGSRADGFWKMTRMKVPDDSVWLSGYTADQCSSQCLSKCSCVAYSYYSSIGCMIWNDTLIDTMEFTSDTGLYLFIRLAYSELEQEQERQGSTTRKSSRTKAIITVAVITGIAIFGVCVWLYRRHGMRLSSKEPPGPPPRRYMIKNYEQVDTGDLPVFELEKLMTATRDFHNENKLGEGGFGAVYKGKLDDGEDIAVKRLSKVSGQGVKEFMTEVLVIAKLQHRNLVRLLGCCVEGNEKLLVYEFLPNKSLDALLFDRLGRELLDWKTRLNIIQGICRGVLYLHRDSRLRIIHRDLKASNILLDDEFTPKISDFGMAKIFGGNEDQAKTRTVAGTYGYMSPEYAMEGRFSEKSDVYSFGVLLLEIVSGRRNSSFAYEESSTLLAHAWKLWNEDDIATLIDPTILKSPFQVDEIMRCIQVALLCVQELPEDRPSISMVISMIEGETSSLPRPTQPGFTRRRRRRYVSHSLSLDKEPQEEIVCGSINDVSVSYIIGR